MSLPSITIQGRLIHQKWETHPPIYGDPWQNLIFTTFIKTQIVRNFDKKMHFLAGMKKNFSQKVEDKIHPQI